MAKLKEKKNLNQRADEFYDYLMERKGQVLRYITAILVTALAEFALKRFLFPEPQMAMVPFLLRFALLFPILKYWVYRQTKQDIFIVLKQGMITRRWNTSESKLFIFFILGLYTSLFKG